MLEFAMNPANPRFMAEAAAVAASFLVAWLLARLFRERLKRTAFLLFPLCSLGFLLLSRALLNAHPLLLVDFSILAALSLAGLRLLTRMLRAILPKKISLGWERAAAVFVLLLLLLHLTGLLTSILDTLDEFSFHFGRQKISLLLLIQGALTAAVSLLVALWASGAIETRIMRAEILDMNLRVMFSKITKSALIVVGALTGLSAAGIDMTALSMFGGALGVGLGLGLQKIASNYVSGFIILLDRSIHLGDIVTVDNRTGMVKQLTNRYIVLKSNDGSESLIPNDTLVTSTVVNHSYSDRLVRIAIPVQVSYASPLETAMNLMRDAARKEPRVLADPAPQALLLSFGDSGINLELGIWIADPENGKLPLISDINLRIFHAFAQHGIEIPFPQREVRLLGTQTAQ